MVEFLLVVIIFALGLISYQITESTFLLKKIHYQLELAAYIRQSESGGKEKEPSDGK